MSSTRKCSLVIEFSGNSRNFKECVSASQELIPLVIPKLKLAVSNCSPGYFYIQYLDDECDLVSVDSEEEIKEFSKLAKLRCVEEKPVRLIVKCEKIPDQEKLTSQREFQQLIGMQNPERNVVLEPSNLASAMTEDCSYFTQWKMDFKSELKQEIMKELKDELSASEEPNIIRNEVANEEDSYSNMTNLSGKMKEKLMHNLKKLEKKEKLFGFEIDHRLEKLEMKRKRLLEKASLRAACRNPNVHPIIGLPFIMSGIATRDSVLLPKKVTVGKVFVHQWRIVNDGTVPWKDVQLIHNWSSPGLESDELSLKCGQLLPGQEDQLTIKFKAPKIVGSFITYWHFVYGADLKQFGHYVSLSGNTKLPKKTCGVGGQGTMQDYKMKSKNKSKAVIVNEEANLIIEGDKSPEEGVIHNSVKSLASTEIAAEMAMEAARALHRRISEKQTDHDLSKKCLEVLNLTDSASDTDINADDNEETDPEFVIVNIPSTEKTTDKDNKIKTSAGDSTDEKKETNVLQNLKVDGNIALPPQLEAAENDNKINTNRVMEKELLELMRKVKTNSPNLKTTLIPIDTAPTDGQNTSPKLPVNMYQQLDQASPLCMPVGYPLQQPVSPHQHPIQSSSSHAFPHPPPNYFPASQTNPTQSYPQIPNDYPEMSSENMPYHQPSVCPPFMKYEYPTKLPTEVIPEIPVATPIVYSPLDYSNNGQTPTHELGLDIFINFNPQSETQVALGDETIQHENITPDNPNPQPQTERVATEQPTNNKNPPVQILPQSLVDGAVTVASHAYSTAWNALNTLCSKENEVQTFDPVFENNMVLLIEMGFRNRERNARLLKRCKNDINQVIGIICTSPGGDNLEID